MISAVLKRAALLATIAGGVVAMSAAAQQGQGILLDERGNRVREAPVVRGQMTDVQSESRSESTYSDGKNTVNVVTESGVTTIKLNGEVVATKQADENWTSHNVIGPDGSVVARVVRFGNQVGIHAGDEIESDMVYSVAPRGWGQGYAGAIASTEPPLKVMMGITMGQPSADLANQLGIEADQTTLVTTVREGLPAAIAGLKAYDVIVSVDGKTPASPQAIREALREKKAGDPLAFEVMRGGKKQAISMTLAEYDGAKLGAGSVYGMPMAPGAAAESFNTLPLIELRNTLSERSKELQAKMSELSEKMTELSSQMSSVAGKQAEELGAQLAALGSELAKVGEELAEELEDNGPKIAAGVREGMIRLQGQFGNELRDLMMIAPPATPTPGVPATLDQAKREAELAARVQSLTAENQALKAERDAQAKAMDERLRRLEELAEKAAKEKTGG